jgi:DNA-binding LytR/AlgR family response regulator
VALDRISRIEPSVSESRIVVLGDGREIPISRSGHARLRELMGS